MNTGKAAEADKRIEILFSWEGNVVICENVRKPASL